MRIFTFARGCLRNADLGLARNLGFRCFRWATESNDLVSMGQSMPRSRVGEHGLFVVREQIGLPATEPRPILRWLACGARERDNLARTGHPMPSPATLFRLLSEFIVLLLGALLIVLAISGRVGLPGQPAALMLLGIVLVYWGARAWARPGPAADRVQERTRAGSLVLVGVFVLGIRVLPLRDSALMLSLAGGVLVLRGLVGSVLLLRRS